MIEQSRQPLDDRQSQAQAFAPVPLRILELVKLAEDLGMALRRNPPAGVPDLDAYRFAPAPASEHYTAPVGVAHGVCQEVADDSGEERRVAHDVR